MVNSLKELAFKINATIKVKEFGILDIMQFFPNASMEQCVTIYAILGGVPAYLEYWNIDDSIENNIKELILNPQGPLYHASEQLLRSELRELAYYQTILSNMKVVTKCTSTHCMRFQISTRERSPNP